MSTSYTTNQQLRLLSGFSGKDRNRAEKALSSQETKRREALDLRSRQMERAGERLSRKLHDLLGVKKWAEFQAGAERERLAFRDALQPPEGLARDYLVQKRTNRHKVRALLTKLGAGSTKLKKIEALFHESREGLRAPLDGKRFAGYSLAGHPDKWASLSPLHERAIPWGVQQPLPDPNDPHRWFVFRPPFFGFLFSFAPQATEGFVSDRTLFLVPNAGLVGNEVTMDATDPGDFGAASGTAEAQIAFGFVPPATGLVEIIIDAQNSMGEHFIDITDNFGFSNAWTYQHNYLMANVLHPNVVEPSIAEMSTASADTDGDDDHVHQVNLTRGQHYFAHLFSAGPVPAGQSVVVTAGTRTFDIARANDMELHSRSNFQWFINSVEVRIAP